MRSLSVWCLSLLTACGGGPYFDVTGQVEGTSLSAQAGFWGGPFVVFVSEPLDCIDMAWVKRNFVDGDEVDTPSDLKALQLVYNDGDVVEGTYSVEGNAPVTARFLDVSAGAVAVSTGRTGSLTVDQIAGNDHAAGTVSIGFDDGSLAGDFEVEKCNNLKTKD